MECRGSIVKEEEEDEEAQFDRMKEQLPNEPRYILYDFGFMKKDSRRVEKLAFIFLCVTLFSVFLTGHKIFPLVSDIFGWILLARQRQSCRSTLVYYPMVKIKNLSRKRSCKCNRIGSLRGRRKEDSRRARARKAREGSVGPVRTL